MSYLCIENLEQLKKEATHPNGDLVDFFILFAGGLAKSSKRILYFPECDEFVIVHEIDESYVEVSSSNLEKETNLIEAISKKCLFKDIG